MARAMKLIRRCTQLIAAFVITGCASTQLPVTPEVQYKPEKAEVVQHVEQNKVVVNLVSVSADTEVSKNFALESIPTDNIADRISSMFKVPKSISYRIVKAADRNAYSDFPSRNEILAIIMIESTFNPNASNHGSLGLMQINKKSHTDKLAGSSLYNIEDNIRIGSEILHEYFVYLNYNKRSAILANNSGIGNFLKKRYNIKYYIKFQKALVNISKTE